MSQSRRASLVESITQTVLGFGVALGAQIWIIFPLFNVEVSLATNFGIGLWFLAISLARQYIIRRAADWIQGWIEFPKL